MVDKDDHGSLFIFTWLQLTFATDLSHSRYLMLAGPFVFKICKSMIKQLFRLFVLWLSDFWQYKMAAAAFRLKRNKFIEINSIYFAFQNKNSWILNEKCKVIVVVTTKNHCLMRRRNSIDSLRAALAICSLLCEHFRVYCLREGEHCGMALWQPVIDPDSCSLFIVPFIFVATFIITRL